MIPDFFYINNRMTVPLEGFLRQFEKEGMRTGNRFGTLLQKISWHACREDS